MGTYHAIEGQDLRTGTVLPVNREAPSIPPPSIPHQSFPNPFISSTSIQYELARPSEVNLIIYDVLGRRVTELIPSQRQDAGQHFIVWDGSDGTGAPVGSGLYVYRLIIDGTVQSGALHRIR